MLDTAERTLERIGIIEEALRSGLSGEELRELLQRKVKSQLAEGAVRAVEHYKNLNKIIEELKNALIHAVEMIASGEKAEKHKEPINADERRYEEPQPEESEEITQANETESPEVEETAKEPKEALMAIIDKLDTGRGTSYDGVIEAASVEGISNEQVESCIKELMAEGRCYEPKIGVLRKVQ